MNKAILAALVTVGGGGITWGGSFGAIQWLDDRYAPMAAVEDVQWTALKKEIRELRQDIEAAKDNAELKARLEQDLQDTIDRLCKAFPDDRECQK